MKRAIAVMFGTAVISLSLLLAPMAFAEEAKKPAETGAAATDTSKEKPCEPKPVKHKKKKMSKKKTKKTEEKKAKEKAPATEEKK